MKKRLLVAAICAASAAVPARAGSMDQGDWRIGGFGTLGVARSDSDQAQFARYNQAEGVADHVRIGLDTNLGLQASYKLNDALSATAQVLTRKNTSPSFSTDLTWAFLKARIDDETSVRVGRVVMPIFLISDYQNVGYANTMMRPPVEMYAQAPIENVDGADLSFQRAFGAFNFSTQAFAGVSRGKLFVPTSGGSVATYRAPAAGVSVSGEYGPVLLRIAHARADLQSDDITPVNRLTTALTAAGFAPLARDISLVGGKRIAFTSIGATMDWNRVVAQAEYARRRAKEAAYIPDTNAWYAMLGYRVGKLLPYYAHAAYSDAGHTIAPPAALPGSGALAASVAEVLASAEQTSDLVGVRWDVAKAVALKMQVDRVKPGAKSGALLFAPAAGIPRRVTVVAAGLDFLF